jgi:hypothetical protein
MRLRTPAADGVVPQRVLAPAMPGMAWGSIAAGGARAAPTMRGRWARHGRVAHGQGVPGLPGRQGRRGWIIGRLRRASDVSGRDGYPDSAALTRGGRGNGLGLKAMRFV